MSDFPVMGDYELPMTDFDRIVRSVVLDAREYRKWALVEAREQLAREAKWQADDSS